MSPLLTAWPAAIRLDDTVGLRQWRVADADALSRVVMANLDHLRPWMPWIEEEPLSRTARAELIARWEAAAATDRHYGIFAGSEVVGSIGAMCRIGPGGLEIGYWLDQRHTGRGLASTAARVLVELAFQTPSISRVEIRHDQANAASAGVPRRLGFVHRRDIAQEAAAPGESGVTWIWEMSRTLWSSQPAEGLPS